VVNLESWASGEQRPRRALRLNASISQGRLKDWKIDNGAEGRLLASSATPGDDVRVALLRNFEFKAPLLWLLATPSPAPAGERKPGATAVTATSKLRLRFSLWQNRLPVDALPLEGWMELQVVGEGDLLYAVT